MYASNTVPCTNAQSHNSSSHVPVETYENRAIIDELSKRCDNSTVLTHEHHECNCKKHEQQKCEQNQCICPSTSDNCKCNHIPGIFGKFGVDDAIIILLIFLLLTDGNSSNDILLPVLLGVLLLT